MAYEVDSSAVAEHAAQWPDDARARFDEVLVVLELTPWNSRPASRSNPSGQFRFLPFDSPHGSGFIYFVIVEHALEVEITEAIWLGYSWDRRGDSPFLTTILLSRAERDDIVV